MQTLRWLIPAYVLLELMGHPLQAQWVQTNGPNGGNVTCFAGRGANLFAGTDSGGVFLSTDSGVNWSNAGRVGLYIFSLAISETSLFAAADSGLFRSTNSGASWSAVTTPVAFVALGTRGATHLFAGSYIGGLYLYDIQTGNWGILSTFFVGFDIIAIAFRDTTILFVGNSSGIYRSTNYGATWADADSGLTNTVVSALVPSGSNIFAGTRGGVFLSTNTGVVWTEVSTGLTETNVLGLGINNPHLFAATLGGSIWRRPLSEMTTAVSMASRVSDEYSLKQNFPNPFNPNTTIQFMLSHSEFITLRIFNILGEQIATLVSKNLSAGTHQVDWGPQGLSSGVYFYRLQAGSFIQTRKLLLLR